MISMSIYTEVVLEKILQNVWFTQITTGSVCGFHMWKSGGFMWPYTCDPADIIRYILG